MDCNTAKELLMDALKSNFKNFYEEMKEQEKAARQSLLQEIEELDDEDFAKVADFVRSLHPCEPKEKDGQ